MNCIAIIFSKWKYIIDMQNKNVEKEVGALRNIGIDRHNALSETTWNQRSWRKSTIHLNNRAGKPLREELCSRSNDLAMPRLTVKDSSPLSITSF